VILSSRNPGQSGLWRSWRIQDRRAFTLVEILVGVTVLALIVLMISQIFSGSSLAISQSSGTMGALDASQAVFQQLGSDVSRMFLRDDVDYSFTKIPSGTSAGNDTLSFYARTTGLTYTGAPPSTASLRALSVVEYQVITNASSKLELDYGALQLDWDNSGSNPLVLTSATQLLAPPNTLPLVTSSTTLAPEVVRMEICFQLVSDPKGNNPAQLLTPTVPVYVAASPVPTSPAIAIPNPIRNVAGILVGIVVIDPKSRLLLPTGADLKVAKLFPDASIANQDLLSLWTPDDTAAKLEGAGVPAKAVSGVHIYQRYFPLPW
jgi:prepilin-type N-terminal cleavage/methylation domain-containing protein